MTNREKMIDLLNKNTEESDLEFYNEFCDNDSNFRQRVLAYTSTRGAYPKELNNKFVSKKEMYNNFWGE